MRSWDPDSGPSKSSVWTRLQWAKTGGSPPFTRRQNLYVQSLRAYVKDTMVIMRWSLWDAPPIQTKISCIAWQVALNLLSKLKRRLKTNSKYRKDYLAFMSDLIEHGHAERGPAEEVVMKNGQVWYIPHHGVYHLKKPDKIRVVFKPKERNQGVQHDGSPVWYYLLARLCKLCTKEGCKWLWRPVQDWSSWLCKE